MGIWRKRFSGGPVAVRAARHAVREQLGDELPRARLDDIELLVSELASNSVRHGGVGAGTLSMQAEISETCVRLRVCDAGAGFEEPREPAPRPDGAGGYGLVLLDRLADRWGVQRDGAFCVWFEIARAS